MICDCPSYYDKESQVLVEFCPLHGDWDYRKWRTKEGKMIFLTDMSDDHLQNTIKFMKRHEELHVFNYFMKYYSGPGPSGDIAMDAYDREIEQLTEATLEDISPVFCNLLDEATRRDMSIMEIFQEI